MANPNEFDDVMPDLPDAEPRLPEKIEENMWSRLIHMILIAIMLSFAQTILTLITVVQFLLTLINQGEPNARIADFGIDLGTWIAKAARYQAMGSEERPWPWTPWE